MKKIIGLMSLCLIFTTLSAFDSPSKNDHLMVTEAHATVIKPARILRYDLIIKNTGRAIEPPDSPSNHPIGINFTVRPNDKLASLMVMETDTRYRKMRPMGGGFGGGLMPGKDTRFHMEYKIKDHVNLEQVKARAFDSTLLILNGTKIISEIPLNSFKK